MGSERSEVPHKPSGLRGAELPCHKKIFGNFFSQIFFLLQNLMSYFLAFFFIFLESSETHFDSNGSKMFHNFIYGDIVVFF